MYDRAMYTNKSPASLLRHTSYVYGYCPYFPVQGDNVNKLLSEHGGLRPFPRQSLVNMKTVQKFTVKC